MEAVKEQLRRNTNVLWAFAAVVILFAIATAVSPSFAGGDSLRSLSTQASLIGLVALGQTFVILVGGVDLSIPWVMSSSALLLASLTGSSDAALIWAVPVTLGFGAGIGFCNGIGVAVFGVSPIIMTLAVNTILSGATVAINSSLSATLPKTINNLSANHVGPISIDVAIWIVAAAVAIAVLARTKYGRNVYAVGSNARVARFSGINVTSTRIVAYMVSGMCAAATGIMVAGFSGQAFAELGSPYLFTSVAAVAIGGASIYGGSGGYLGTIAGAMVLTVLVALLPILHLNSATLNITYGVVILLTVALARLRHGDQVT